MDNDDAIKATRQGAIAACISGVITTAVYFFAVFSKATDENALGYWNDPSILFDIGLIFLLAWFIYKKSRTAAILMFLYFAFSKIYIGLETGKFTGGFLALVFLYYYGRAIWGAFVFHKIEKAKNPNYRKTKKWVWFIITPISAIIIGVLAFGALTMTGLAPSTEVQSGSDIEQSHIDKLISENIVSSRDEIEYFYSEGLFSVLDGGNILTTDKVISYTKTDDGELEVYSIDLKDVKSIEVTKEGDYLTDAVYEVTGEDAETWLELWLSTENKGHLKFINALKSKTVEKASKE